MKRFAGTTDKEEVMDHALRISRNQILTSAGLWLTIALWLLPMGVSANQDEPENCLKCHGEYFARLSGEYNHAPFESKDCYTCHQFHEFRNAQELAGEIIDLCSNCHETAYEVDEDRLHYPLTDEESCVTCHNPHSADNKYFLKQPTTTLCFECHDEPDNNADFLHPPYRDSLCVDCHDPHGSDFGTFFQMPVGYLCMSCHENITNAYSPAEMHTADEINSCANCHVGHEAAHSHLLKMEPYPLCLSCHQPIGEAIAVEKHAALEDEDCLTCHQQHFAKGGSHLVEPQKELCLTCHSDIEESLAAEFGHAVLEDEDCTLCHNPHTGQLTEAQPDLCLTCHDADDSDFSDRHNGLSPVRCGDCHNPHGSPKALLIREILHVPFEDGDCESCHEEGQSREDLKSEEICLVCHDVSLEDDTHKSLQVNNKTCVDCHSPHSNRRR